MKRTTNHSRALIISYGVSACIFFYLCFDLDWELFLVEIGKSNFYYIPLFFIMSFALAWIRTLRWSLLLPRELAISMKELFFINAIGSMSILLLPLRAGEFVRPWMLSSARKIKFPQAFGGIVIERVCDVLALLGMLGISMMSIEKAPALVDVGAKALGMLAGVILLLMFVAYFKANFALGIIEKIIYLVVGKRSPQLAAKLHSFIEEFFIGLKAISSGGELALVVFFSLLLWVFIACYYQLGLLAFGADASWIVANTVSVMIALAIAAPSAPGFLGTFQFGCIVALSVVHGYSREFGLSYSIVMHAYQVAAIIAIGLYCLHKKHLHLSDIASVKDRAL
ncbi:MAG: flippase-like domain-containing protein [Deltaproteobacteria bacterium]|nr:flippase-like domain-containing protein [Deltaproteobacteria bacterium]